MRSSGECPVVFPVRTTRKHLTALSGIVGWMGCGLIGGGGPIVPPLMGPRVERVPDPGQGHVTIPCQKTEGHYAKVGFREY